MKPLDRDWRPVVTDKIPEGLYEVSEFGDVWSVRSGKMIKSRTDRDGYLRICLRLDGNQGDYTIAKLVTLAFYGPPPDWMERPSVDHIDGDITNNHYVNLRWLDARVNSSIRKNKGFGSMNSHHKLSKEDVKNIHRLLEDGHLTYEQIGKVYGVTGSAIRNIKNGKTWKNVYKEVKAG